MRYDPRDPVRQAASLWRTLTLVGLFLSAAGLIAGLLVLGGAVYYRMTHKTSIERLMDGDIKGFTRPAGPERPVDAPLQAQ